MAHYTLNIANPHRQYLQFRGVFSHDGSEHFALQLPAWRPGRYELGNFAKNVKHFSVSDNSGKPLDFSKRKKDHWVINAKNCSQVIVEYKYYSAELNAGSTFLNEKILYVNPVNCFMYRPGREEAEGFEVELKVPDDYLLASPLAEKSKKSFVTKDLHELLDSPFMTSAELQHHTFEESGCNFHIWINGEHELDVHKIETDFRPFCQAQIRDFDGIPVDDYLFLFHFLAHNSYHGVEHNKCTVITLGPAKKLLTEDFYQELLGVSSHELYHTWNVKALRPNDMLPYDYTKENYSELGFVYEGVTTYMGDWYLFNSEVFDFTTYARNIGQYFTKHFHNHARLNYSVAESSFDTWLDGYTAGAPGRKVSIYTEGCLIAFICDLIILKATNGESNLAACMKLIWERIGLTGKGYSEQNYFNALKEVSGISFDEIRTKLVHGSEDFQPFFDSLLPEFGMSLELTKNRSAFMANTGLKVAPLPSGELRILDVFPDSPADKKGIHITDSILSVNGASKDLAKTLNQMDFSKNVDLEIVHLGEKAVVSVLCKEGNYFPNAALTKTDNPTESQQFFFNKWRGEKIK